MVSTQLNRRTVSIFLGTFTLLTSLLLLTSLSLTSSTLLPTIQWSSPSTPTLTPHGPTTYIPFTFGWTMLLQTLRGYQKAEWPNIVVVDNSWNAYADGERELLRGEYGVVDVIPTPVHLRFTQLQAFLDHLARGSGEDVYFWSHTDVLFVPFHQDVFRQATECVYRANENGTLGVMWFMYDLLSAVTVNAGRVAPWDPAMPQYGSDCDRYKRLRLAGLETRDCEERIGEMIHLHSVLSEGEMGELFDRAVPLEERVATVREIDGAREQYSWREGDGRVSMTEADKQAKEAEGDGGRRYHEAKWGWGPPPCELDDRVPNFDVPQWEKG